MVDIPDHSPLGGERGGGEGERWGKHMFHDILALTNFLQNNH